MEQKKIILNHTEPFPDVYQIQDGCGNFATLVVGQQKALLYDTLMGAGDLRSYVEHITQLPLLVINSHCHPDHCGGNTQFDQVYCSFEDLELFGTDFCEKYAAATGHTFELLPKERLLPLAEGDTFDLGGIHAEVLALPGHTKGSLGVLLPEKQLLLAADAISPQMCLFLEGTLTLKEYRKTLEKLKTIEFSHFLLGHFAQPFRRELLEQLEACSRLPGHKRGYLYAYSQIPEYQGMFYIYETRNQEIQDMICIITKEGDCYEES